MIVARQAHFAGKKIVVFTVLGAFTSIFPLSKHMPSYLEHYDALKECVLMKLRLSINDARVMHAWGDAQNVGDKIKMLADQSGAFSEAFGLAVYGACPWNARQSRLYCR